MKNEKPISRFAQRFVARKLQQLSDSAIKGTGLFYELYAQRFTDAVDGLADRIKRSDLRQYVLAEAEKTGNYFGEAKGQWVYDQENNDIHWVEATSTAIGAAECAEERRNLSAAAKYGARDHTTEPSIRHADGPKIKL